MLSGAMIPRAGRSDMPEQVADAGQPVEVCRQRIGIMPGRTGTLPWEQALELATQVVQARADRATVPGDCRATRLVVAVSI